MFTLAKIGIPWALALFVFVKLLQCSEAHRSQPCSCFRKFPRDLSFLI